MGLSSFWKASLVGPFRPVIGALQIMRPSVFFRSQECLTLLILFVSVLLFSQGGATGFFLGMAALASITGVVARGAWFERIPVDSSAENFEKKYAVVTGGTQGIGAELVAQLKEQGYEVMDAGRSANGHYLDLGEAASIVRKKKETVFVFGAPNLYFCCRKVWSA